MMSGTAFFTHEAGDQRFRYIHRESGFDWGLPGGVHDFRAGLIVEEPALALVNGRAVHDRDGQKVVAVVGLLDQHELASGRDRQFLIADSFLEVVGQRAEEESILYPRGAVVREGAYLALRKVLFFTKYSYGFRFFERVHVQPHEVFGQSRYFVHVFRLDDPSGDRHIAKQFAGGEPASSGNQSPPASVPSGHDDCLQQAVLSDAFGELLYALIGDVFPKCGAIHVDLIEPDVLFHRAGLRWLHFDRLQPGKQAGSLRWFPPQSPLSTKSKIR